jgi:hypothetical protein
VKDFGVALTPSLNSPIQVRLEPANPSVVDALLRTLPAWFGIEEAIAEYVAAAFRLPNYLARDSDGSPVGVLLLERHFPRAAEVYLMAVAPTHHWTGMVGRCWPRSRRTSSRTG